MHDAVAQLFRRHEVKRGMAVGGRSARTRVGRSPAARPPAKPDAFRRGRIALGGSTHRIELGQGRTQQSPREHFLDAGGDQLISRGQVCAGAAVRHADRGGHPADGRSGQASGPDGFRCRAQEASAGLLLLAGIPPRDSIRSITAYGDENRTHDEIRSRSIQGVGPSMNIVPRAKPC